MITLTRLAETDHEDPVPNHLDHPGMAWDRLCELVTELERDAVEVRDQEA